MQTQNAIGASTFQQQPNNRCLGRFRSFVSAIARDELDTINQEVPNNLFKTNDPPNFLIRVANGQLENPLAPATLKFGIGDYTFAEHFVVMKKPTGPIKGWHFMRNNSVVIDMTQDLIRFSHLTMQIKTTSELSAKLQALLTDDALTIPPRTTKTITAFVDHPSQWNTTILLGKFTETTSLLISHTMSGKIDRKVAVRVTITTKTPNLIEKETQIADFSVVAPEQAKFNKPVDMAILNTNPKVIQT